jgi:hypothetical protein
VLSRFEGPLPQTSSRLSLLVELASILAREIELDKLLEIVCQRVAEALSAERATIWLHMQCARPRANSVWDATR